jgi:hypothetical protein
MDDWYSKNALTKNTDLSYPSIRHCLSKLCAFIKTNSKLPLGFSGEDLCLLAWKDAHDILLRKKYRIYHMVAFAHNYIHRFLLAPNAERDVSKADGKLGSTEALCIFSLDSYYCFSFFNFFIVGSYFP